MGFQTREKKRKYMECCCWTFDYGKCPIAKKNIEEAERENIRKKI